MKKFICKKLLNIKREYSWKKQNIYIARGSYVSSAARIGRCTRVNAPSHIGTCEIGRFCAIGGRLVVRSTNHDISYLNMSDWCQQFVIRSNVKVAGVSKGSIKIGNGVWIGDSVIILPGGNIGDGAVVGAGSVVTKPIPKYSVAVGNPARVIKKRFSKEIEALVDNLQWWYWNDDKIYNNRELFEINLMEAQHHEIVRAFSSVRD